MGRDAPEVDCTHNTISKGHICADCERLICFGCNMIIEGKPWFCTYHDKEPMCEDCAGECYQEDNMKHADYEPGIHQ